MDEKQKDKLRKWARMQAEFREEKQRSDFGLLALNYDNVHLNAKLFLALFEDYKVKDRGWDQWRFPAELSAEFEGVKFFCILAVDEWQELEPEAQGKIRQGLLASLQKKEEHTCL